MGAPGTTPGPWQVAKRSARRVTNAHGIVICNAVLRNQGGPKAKSCLKDAHEAEANAHQIAASGDLYDALVDELADLNEDIRWAEGSDMVRFIARRERMEAALAKAQGIIS